MEFKKLPKALFTESVQSLEIFWSKVDKKPTWNTATKKFDGPLTEMVTVGFKGTGMLDGQEVEGLIFEDIGNYIMPPSDGKSGSKLFDMLKVLLGEKTALSFAGKRMTADGDKKAGHLEGVGRLSGYKLAALVANKKNGTQRIKTFLPSLPAPVNSFSQLQEVKPKPSQAQNMQTGFEGMEDIKPKEQPVSQTVSDDDLPW